MQIDESMAQKNRNTNPLFDYVNNSVIHALSTVQPPPRLAKQRSFNHYPTIIRLMQRKSILAQKNYPNNYAPAGSRSDGPSIMRLQTYLRC